MARKSFGYSKKISIDLTDESFAALESLKSDIPAYVDPSNSIAINHLLSIYGCLNEDARIALSDKCIEMIEELEIKNARLPRESYKYIDNKIQIKTYETLNAFFNGKNGLEKNDAVLTNMKRLDIKGGYVVYPEDWIYLNIEPPDSSTNALVIETLHGGKYDAPHFIFTSSRKNISDDYMNAILEQAVLAYPKFRKILNLRVDPIYESNGLMLNKKEWEEAPCPGVFFIPEANNPYMSNRDYPFGAKVFRTKSEQGVEK